MFGKEGLSSLDLHINGGGNKSIKQWAVAAR